MAASAVEQPQPDPLRIDVLLTAARIAWTAGSTEQSRRRVVRAAAIAEPDGLVRRFCDAGPVVRDVLTGLVDRPSDHAEEPPVSTRFVSRLARACSGPRPAWHPTSNELGIGLIEQLSAREMEVLQMLDRGLSYSDIGSELFVSRNTVKTHVRHVYTKLAVAGRRDAVDKARQLGLL